MLRQSEYKVSAMPSMYSPKIEKSSDILSYSGLRTPQQQQRKLPKIKTNMIGLSSVSYVKKNPKDLPPISTSVSSPKSSGNSACRSPFSTKKQQLPMYVRKQQQQQEMEENDSDDDDEREIIRNHSNHNAYGVPTNNAKSQSKQQQIIVTQSDLNQKIRVCVRKRPLSKKEIDKSEKDITPVASVRTVNVNEPK